MSKPSKLIPLVGMLVMLAVPALPQSRPPRIYIDKGACPFECCTYGKWTTKKTTIAYTRPDRRSRVVGKLKAGSSVTAITGEVRTTPGLFTITKNHGKYRPGDVLCVYTPLGEGDYKVWFKGKMYSEGLHYMSGPFERSHPPCEETPECWGKLTKKMRVAWWVKIRSAEGWIGWTDLANNFSGTDGCG